MREFWEIESISESWRLWIKKFSSLNKEIIDNKHGWVHKTSSVAIKCTFNTQNFFPLSQETLICGCGKEVDLHFTYGNKMRKGRCKECKVEFHIRMHEKIIYTHCF